MSLKNTIPILLIIGMALSTTSCTTRYVNAQVHIPSNFGPSDETKEWVKKNKDDKEKVPDHLVESLANCERAERANDDLESAGTVTNVDPGPTWAWVSGIAIAAWLAVKSFFGGIFSWFLP